MIFSSVISSEFTLYICYISFHSDEVILFRSTTVEGHELYYKSWNGMYEKRAWADQHGTEGA